MLFENLAKSFLARRESIFQLLFNLQSTCIKITNCRFLSKTCFLQDDYFPCKRPLLNTLTFLMVAITSESAAVVSMAQRMRAIQPF